MKKALMSSVIASAFVGTIIVAIVGCGGGKSVKGSLLQSGAVGSLILTVDWGNSRVIPPETVKLDVTIAGDGLPNPVSDSINRPQNQTVVTKVYTLPVGFKRVTVEAKDSNERIVASGQGTTVLTEGQRTNLEIVLQEVTGPQTVLVRTLQNNQPTPPLFIAYQDGDGNWQVPQGNGEYSLQINDPQGRYGIAVVTQQGEVMIIHALVSEISELNFALDEPVQNRVTVSGTVSGLGTDEMAVVSIGDSETFAYSQFPNYQVTVSPGTHDLVAVKASSDLRTVNKILIRRNINISGNTTINIDFNSADAFDPEVHLGTVTGVMPSEAVYGLFQFITENRTSGWLSYVRDANFQIPTVPVNRQQPNEFHYLTINASEPDGSDSFRSVIKIFKAPTDISVTLPSPMGNVQVVANITTPYVRFTTSWDAYSGAQVYLGEFHQQDEIIRRRWQIYLTGGWLDGQTSYTLPDFSGLNGWNNDWGIASTDVRWSFSAVVSNRTIRELVDFYYGQFSQSLDGLEVRLAGRGRGMIQ